MTTPTTRRVPKAEQPAPKPSRSRKPAEPKPAPAPAPKAVRGPRGEHLDRHGVTLEGELAGYVIALAFAEFELARHPDHAGWVTVCVAHGTCHPAPTKGEAEKAGACKARVTWCRQCAKAAK